MFLIGSFTNPGSRVLNDGRRVDAGQRKPERKSRRIVEEQVAAKGRHRRALPQGYFGYRLGHCGNPPTTQNTTRRGRSQALLSNGKFTTN